MTAPPRDPRGVRLDPLDRRLLTLVDRHPAGSLASFAEHLGVSARTVARRLARMQATRTIRVIGRTLPGFDGRLARLVRLKGHPETVGALGRLMAREEHTRWVRLSRDTTELICGFVTPAADDDAAFRRLVNDPHARSIRVHEPLQVWSQAPEAVVAPTRELDDIDRQLLTLLEEDGRMEATELGQRLRIDPSTASRRRRRLIDEGILYFEAGIHPSALGGAGDAMLWMSVAPGHLHELGGTLRKNPDIRFAASISGGASLVVHVLLPDTVSLVSFVDKQLAGHGVSNVEIVPIGHVLKRTR